MIKIQEAQTLKDNVNYYENDPLWSIQILQAIVKFLVATEILLHIGHAQEVRYEKVVVEGNDWRLWLCHEVVQKEWQKQSQESDLSGEMGISKECSEQKREDIHAQVESKGENEEVD